MQRHDPLSPTRECIIPCQALDGLLTALHIQLGHPSCHQLKMVVKRYLFALDLDKAVSRVSEGCHSCAAIWNSPTAHIDQSTSPPPEAIGQSFAADVMKRSRQLIFVLCKTVTSYTCSLFLENELHQTLHNAIIKLCLEMRRMDGPPAVIRTDPAPGLKALLNDPLLKKHRVNIELGQPKNPNKNPTNTQTASLQPSPQWVFQSSCAAKASYSPDRCWRPCVPSFRSEQVSGPWPLPCCSHSSTILWHQKVHWLPVT